MRGPGAFFLGMGYSAAWFAGLLNTFVLVQRLGSGQSPDSFLPVALASWAIIAWVHYRAGWFPFRGRRASSPPSPKAGKDSSK